MNAKVSIIVPVYNVEKYLDRCLKSLVNQTIEQYEIIIVVDGSTDNSIEIVKKYKDKYPQIIKYFETENRGLSAARNYGIEKATGEYIGFVDSDDYIEINMYEELYKCAKNNHYDIVVCDYYKVMEKEKKEVVIEITKDADIEEVVLKSKPYAWNKIYKKSVFEKYNLKFPEGLIFEDISTIYPLIMQVEKVGYLNEKMYFYNYSREDSIMKNKVRKDLHILESLAKLNDYCTQNKLFNKYKDLICEINVRHIYYRLREVKRYNNRIYNLKFVYRCFKMLNKQFPNWRTKSVYANKIKKKSKSMFFWQLKVLLGR